MPAAVRLSIVADSNTLCQVKAKDKIEKKMCTVSIKKQNYAVQKADAFCHSVFPSAWFHKTTLRAETLEFVFSIFQTEVRLNITESLFCSLK